MYIYFLLTIKFHLYEPFLVLRKATKTNHLPVVEVDMIVAEAQAVVAAVVTVHA